MYWEHVEISSIEFYFALFLLLLLSPLCFHCEDVFPVGCYGYQTVFFETEGMPKEKLLVVFVIYSLFIFDSAICVQASGKV